MQFGECGEVVYAFTEVGQRRQRAAELAEQRCDGVQPVVGDRRAAFGAMQQ